ncbi:diguanylate cyclase with PAS/PAC and Chase2 sensors [Gloeocapsa sp. PCC 7428]|uniref:CHASE2 domain-containing protein n=1 Tax=Gloeocapsa sp. PCC 7428 TaxID=1173026 RepID=UPI0002A5EC01|nr:CHASE2 domain-containing protein [Gloeocapsa sp. PCC 7428]AFZ32320.1 diguanylate cyclase with PAS/PAC and Chase2 sensors [Gloeocapsa sp. PCC 7428]
MGIIGDGSKGTKKRLFRGQLRTRNRRRVWLTALSVTSCILLLRYFGVIQSLEWAALDQFFRLRPPEPTDERIAIVAIEEADLQSIGKWPLPDTIIAQLLQQLHRYQPRVIGLDLYRDLPVEPGHEQLQQTYKSLPNLIGIEKLEDEYSAAVLPPLILNQQGRVGFNNVILDADGKVRRSLLYWTADDKTHESFALKLALSYLASQGIAPQPAQNPDYLRLGKSVFPCFKRNDGGYAHADDGGYQIISNFRHPQASFRTVSLTDVLTNKVPAEWFRDRIVLIGSTAPSLKDFFFTPYSSSFLTPAAQPIAGVELHANFISQILDAALIGRPVIQVWSKLTESLWIFAWTFVGASLSWRLRKPTQFIVSLAIATALLVGSTYIAFTAGWWLPVVPPLLGIAGCAVAIASHIAYQQEGLQRSKEFLQEVINTIPDPVFVKNQQHQWIVLNDAFCQFIGYPLEELLEKSDYQFLPQHQADISWQQDDIVFVSGNAIENEEELTDSRGITHLVATKKSLHKDAAGNLFLVGVMRDITERKRIEEELKRTAAELLRSNTELQHSQDRLRYLAYHDSLTGLPNRKLFYDHLNQSLAWAENNKLSLALLFIDLDGFKQVNDTLGHDSGDRLLVTVAQRLTLCLRGSDIVSRLGGDEFTVILPGIAKADDAATVAEKILTMLSQEFHLNGHTICITASIGISIYPNNGTAQETIVKQADLAMYQAKRLGKNCYQFAEVVPLH